MGVRMEHQCIENEFGDGTAGGQLLSETEATGESEAGGDSKIPVALTNVLSAFSIWWLHCSETCVRKAGHALPPSAPLDVLSPKLSSILLFSQTRYMSNVWGYARDVVVDSVSCECPCTRQCEEAFQQEASCTQRTGAVHFSFSSPSFSLYVPV